MSQLSGFNNNSQLSGLNNDRLLDGLNSNPILGTNSNSSQNETKHYYPEIISTLQQMAGSLLPNGTAMSALQTSIQQMEFNWNNRAGRDYYMNDFGVQTLVNQIKYYDQIDRMRAGQTNIT